MVGTPQAQATVTCYKRDYIGVVEYIDDILESVFTEEGRINVIDNRHEYSVKDHLGNTRICFAYDPTATTTAGIRILQQNNYYPSGLPIEYLTRQYPYQPFSANSLRNNYQYNYKEWNDDLGLFLNDYGARWYNPQLNQWHQIDPLAENYYALSSYNYVANNPIKYIDPDGQWVSEFDEVQAAPGGENPPEVPGCPDCDPAVPLMQEVVITATRTFGELRDVEAQIAFGNLIEKMQEKELAQMFHYVDNITGGDAITVDNTFVQLFAGPEDVVLYGGAKLFAIVPFIAKGVKWGAPVGKVTRIGSNLTKSQLRSISSLENQILKHKAKLAEYIKDPMKFDNKGFLKNAPNDVIRQRIIDARKNHLQQEIKTFQDNIQKIINQK